MDKYINLQIKYLNYKLLHIYTQKQLLIKLGKL